MESKSETRVGTLLTVIAAAHFVLIGCGNPNAAKRAVEAKLEAEVKSHVQGVIKKWKLPLDPDSVSVDGDIRGMPTVTAVGPSGKVWFSVVCKSSRCIVWEAGFELGDKWFDQIPVPLNEENVQKIAELLPVDSMTKLSGGQFVGGVLKFGIEFVEADGRHTTFYVDPDTGKLVNLNEAYPK